MDSEFVLTVLSSAMDDETLTNHKDISYACNYLASLNCSGAESLKSEKSSATFDGDCTFSSDSSSIPGLFQSMASTNTEQNIKKIKNTHVTDKPIENKPIENKPIENTLGWEITSTPIYNSTIHGNSNVFLNNFYEPKNISLAKNVNVLPDYLFLPFQCTDCSIRFSTDELLQIHAETHRRMFALSSYNTVNRPVARRRPYFLSDSSFSSHSPHLVLPDNILYKKIPWNLKEPSCFVCHELIAKVWDNQEETWILENSVSVSEDNFAHIRCVE